jgi:hypothetical protein
MAARRWWNRYWHAPGGRYSAAVLRVAIATSVLMSLWRLWHLDRLAADAAIYRAVGIWRLLGASPPPEALVSALWVAAWAGTFAMLVGLRTRTATAVSALASIALAALSFSGRAHWSHQYNVTLLAQLAFLGARGGDALSVDAALRRLRRLPALDLPGAYQWSVRLVLLAVSLMFVGAALHKLGASSMRLDWALSDNLRHQLLVRYDLTGIERPPIVEWLLAESWRYRGAALANLATQLAPALAVALVHRPLVRAAAGAAFVLEVLGLGVVMLLWNWPWLPLAAVYIDWDALRAWIRRRAGAADPAGGGAEAAAAAPPGRARRAFVIAFVAITLATSITGVDAWVNAYPFSSFPMFSSVRARLPLDRHQPYSVAGDRYEAIADRPIAPAIQRWLDYQNRGLHVVADPAKVKARLASTLARAQARYPDAGIRGLRHFVAFFVAPAHPGPARFTRHEIALTGELAPDGTFRSALGAITAAGVALAPIGIDPTGARLVAYYDDDPAPHPLAAEPIAGGLRVAPGALARRPIHVVIEVGGARWLVAARARRDD